MWCACGSQYTACPHCSADLDAQSWMPAWHMLYIVTCLQCWMSVGQDCDAVSCLQEMHKRLGETTLLLMQHGQAYDLAEAWAVNIADEVAAHKQAIQQVEDAKLRLPAQPTSHTAAASLSARELHLTQLRRHFERVSAETWSTVSGLVCDVTSVTDGFNHWLPKNILLDVADTCFMLFSQTCFLPLQLHLIVSCKIKAMWMLICRSIRTKAGRPTQSYLRTALLNSEGRGL